jgi:ATP dependent DNA ligase domain
MQAYPSANIVRCRTGRSLDLLQSTEHKFVRWHFPGTYPLRGKRRSYDLLALNGEDLRKMPLHERRRRLADLLADNDVIRFSGHVEGAKGAALFRRACAMGLEGIVSKRVNTPYRSGPFLGWRKIKCPGYARP